VRNRPGIAGYEYVHKDIITVGCRLETGRLRKIHGCSHGDVNELDQVPYETHDGKANRNSFGNLNEFFVKKYRINGFSRMTQSMR
jgi:hypothetical protein